MANLQQVVNKLTNIALAKSGQGPTEEKDGISKKLEFEFVSKSLEKLHSSQHGSRASKQSAKNSTASYRRKLNRKNKGTVDYLAPFLFL